MSKRPQIDTLDLGLDVVVAIPDRLLDLIERGHIKFDELEVFVFPNHCFNRITWV